MMQPERRRAPRTAERLAVAITEASVEVQTSTHNLSASGVYCALNRFIEPMTKLQLRFEIPDGSHAVNVCCAGVVVRVEPATANASGPYRVAIFFTDLTERHRALIERFVRQRLPVEPHG